MSPKNIIPVVITIITRIITPIFVWHLWHIPEGVSSRGYFSLHKGQAGAVVASLCFDFIISTYDRLNINLIISGNGGK
jgi:hypothetical protein